MEASPPALAELLGRNLRQLRESRDRTQAELATLAGIPRATWANLESGNGNPTLAVLRRVADALQVTIEELIAQPRAACQFYPHGSLPERLRGTATVRKLLPDAIPGMEIDRMELPGRATLVGVPHTPGTREYFICETGVVQVTAAGERWRMGPGDVLAFRGDQRHAYTNPEARPAIGYSVVVLARVRTAP